VIEENINAPVYVYYQLDNFYQNHRRYVKSKDSKQLMGQVRTVDDVKDNCTPVVQNSDLKNGTTFLNGSPVSNNPTGVASPCGLIAKSVFTDGFTLLDPAGNNITIDDSNIAWKSDVDYKYKQAPDAWNT
jgi:hypothetical protein